MTAPTTILAPFFPTARSYPGQARSHLGVRPRLVWWGRRHHTLSCRGSWGNDPPNHNPRQSSDERKKCGRNRESNIIPSGRINQEQPRDIHIAECNGDSGTDDGDDSTDLTCASLRHDVSKPPNSLLACAVGPSDYARYRLIARNKPWPSFGASRKRAHPNTLIITMRGSLVQQKRVDHGRYHVHVPQELLHRAEIVAGFQQMSSKRMPQAVGRG